MLNYDLSSERVEVARNLNVALHRSGYLLVTPWRAYDTRLVISVFYTGTNVCTYLHIPHHMRTQQAGAY